MSTKGHSSATDHALSGAGIRGARTVVARHGLAPGRGVLSARSPLALTG